MSDLKAARYVTVLTEQKTIRGAAETLYISPSALSMYIRKLEQELGAPLFVRDQKNFTPTQIGEAYVRRSYKILAVDQEFMDELALWRRRETHQISIGIYRRRGISFMVPLMKALEEMVPDVQFTFRLGSVKELEQLLYGRQIDYILITHRLQNPDFTYQFVCGDRLLLACPASWQDRTEVSPDGTRILLPLEKVSADQILMPGVHQSIYPFAAHFLEIHGIHNTRQSPASNMEIHMQSVAAELGCCFTLASYIPTFSHIPGILFASPAVKEEPVSWSLASLASPLETSRLSILKTAIHSQIAQMIP